MTDTEHMRTMLETLVHDSKFDMLFKLGRIRQQSEKLPHWVSVRLKLHNPYTFLEFSLTEKKSGLKFGIQYLKSIPAALRKTMLEMGGAPDNSNTYMEFPADNNGGLLSTLQRLCTVMCSPEMAAACNAESYKPLKLLRAAPGKDDTGSFSADTAASSATAAAGSAETPETPTE